MKKILFSVFAMAAMLFATSCSQEEDFNLVADGSEVNVSFSVELPQIATRTYSDGLTAKTLEYAFYDAADVNESKKPLLKGATTLTDKTATVNVNLATGKTYNILFWAQKEGNTNYFVDWNAQTLTVDYSKGSALANNEENDAFYAFVDDLTVDGALTETVELYRPFAQINLGTSDYAAAAAAGLTVDRSAMKAAVLPNVLYFDGGEVDGEVTVEFTANTIARGETFPVKDAGYEYLEMNYVLVGASKSTIDCEFYIYETGKEKYLEPTIVVSNVPVQRNYRTNIYGALLTDPATFNVEIIPAYETPDYNAEVWDSKAEPVQPNADGVYVVNNASELAWVAQQLSAKNITEGTIQLAADIYLDGNMWTPIDLWNPENAGVITIDGQGHTINGMNVKGGPNAGFIGKIANDLVIKDLTFTDANVETSSSFAGVVIGYQYGDVVMEGVTVTGATVKSTAEKGIRLGGLVGFSVANDGATLELTNCKVEDSKIIGYHNLAGLVGTVNAAGKATMTDCQSNNNIFVHGAEDEAAWQDFDANSYAEGKAVKTNCTTEGNRCVVVDGVLMDKEGNYEVYNANGLAWVAQQTLDGNTFAGKTVKLTENIDLNGAAWSPIGGNVEHHPNQTFAGVFDGNGKTVSNFVATDYTAGNASAGLFGTLTGEVKDLTVKDATITSSHYAGAIVGYITDNTGAKITNCHVEDVTITSAAELLAEGSYDNGDKVGGIVGYAHDVTVDGCSVKNATLQGYRDLGGIAGYLGKGGEVTNCKVLENVVIKIDYSQNYKGYSDKEDFDANSIVGEGNADDTNTGTATIQFAGNVLSVTWAEFNVGADASNLNGDFFDKAGALALENDEWRLPTEEECMELVNNCLSEEVEKDGVKGILFTNLAGGQSIFFPYAGHKNPVNSATITDAGRFFYVWTSKHTENGWADEWYFANNDYMATPGLGVYHTVASMGKSVRLVKK